MMSRSKPCHSWIARDAHVESAQESRICGRGRALPAKQRHTLELRFYQGCTFAEIAAGMNCPVGTAKANYHHAITALRKRNARVEP